MGIYAEARNCRVECSDKSVALHVAEALRLHHEKSDEYGNEFAEEIEADGEDVSFVASSGRVQNLEYQLEAIWEAIKGIKGVKEMYAPIMVEGEGMSFSNE